MATSAVSLQQKLNESLAAEGIELRGRVTAEYAEILTPEALRFLAKMARQFEATRRELLERRVARYEEIKAGKLPDFLPETRHIRAGDWTVAPIPDDLQDRRVEITGPVDRKMVINALNSGASVFMADFEDAHTPTWDNNLEGQINLRDAVVGTISFTNPQGKHYELGEDLATLLVRPRGWHLVEKHLLIDGEPISGSLFDFGLYFFHNVEARLQRNTAPYFYLPKMESHLEARLWNDVFTFAEKELSVPNVCRGTVLLETILAAFEMDEILYELRDHSAGLNCGRWDYIFSFIKKFRHDPAFVLPDRIKVGMDRHFLNSYVELLIKTCHRRGIHAMGGMAAQIPIKNDPEANEQAINKVRQDKLREVRAGHDGTWVAHPGLVGVAREIFDEHMPTSNQIWRDRGEVSVKAEDLLTVPEGEISEDGLRINCDVGIQYLESWLRGVGCVPIYNLMEDAATAEISRSQVWHWVQHGAKMNDGRRVTVELVRETIPQQLEKIRGLIGPERYDAGKFDLASKIFEDMMTSDGYSDFLTLIAYEHID